MSPSGMRESRSQCLPCMSEMHTSRTQVDRVLDPENGNVTIETLQRAAELVGRKLQLELA